jgi:homoserine O-succinyltransferase/O-acetyltransferase
MLTIGMVNNMPLPAIQSTERQFRDILTVAAREDIPFQLRWFRLAGARPDNYGRLDDLLSSDLDGLIVTGAEPRASSLTDEPIPDDERVITSAL